ncbi:MAG: phosphatidylglycerol lysyltransferase domain-containing protein [Pseudomonadota bacterium]
MPRRKNSLVQTTGKLVRVALPFVIFAVCAYALSFRVTPEMLADLPAKLAAIAPWQWAVAVLLTAISLYSVGAYDVLAHRYLRTRLPERAARMTGSIGIAVGQTLGFGLFTGGFARWRMMPALGMTGALKLSAFVSISFFMAWLAVFSATALVLPTDPWVTWLGAAGCVAAIVLLGVFFRWPSIWIGRIRLRLPSWRLCGGILGWALVDTVAAAGVLYVMLPFGTIPFASFFPLFLMAMGAALISNTPGGLGPFELVLLSALGTIPTETVITAVLAYRVVYYALPAAVAALALLRPFRVTRSMPAKPIKSWPEAPRSEVGVVRQNGGAVLGFGSARLALWSTGQTLTMLADPVRGKARRALDTLARIARMRGKLPLAYKISARLALAARGAGWQVIHLADDAMIPLSHYTPDTPARRTLRRKLRAAKKADIRLMSDGPLNHVQMARVDAAWQETHGRARGGTMGRYCPEYLVHQWVGTAWQDGRCVAFITTHKTAREWCLDLMRHDRDVPDGTMHALVSEAIEAARAAGAERFCLAATPACPDPGSAFWRWVAVRMVSRAGGPGLRQFKSSFGPIWEPRYVAAPTAIALFIGVADLVRAIHRPQHISRIKSNAPHIVDENNEVASQRAA